MAENFTEMLRGDGYGKSLEIIEGLIFPRVEELPAARYVIQEEYKDYTSHYSVNPILYEVLQEGDPASLIEDERWAAHKEFLFDLLYLREVRGINPLPRTHAHYSYVKKKWYMEYDDLTELITKYFGILSVTEESCKSAAQQFHQYCVAKEQDNEVDETAPDPYYAEIYDIYLTLMNDAYEIGGAELPMLKRYVSFLRCQEECLPTFLKTYLYHDYPWDKEPLFVRGQLYYQRAVGELINILHQAEGIDGVKINYDRHETKLLKSLWYPRRSASDAIVFLAVREHAILDCFDKVMSAISEGRKRDIGRCLEMANIFQQYKEIFSPFIPALEKLMREHHHFLRSIYCAPAKDN